MPQPFVVEGAGNGGIDPDDAPLMHIGGESLVADQWFHGLIDEVRMAPHAVPRPGLGDLEWGVW